MTTDETTRGEVIGGRPSWFGVAGSVVAWFALGLGDMLVTWRVCLHQEQYGWPASHPAVRILYFVITFVLIGIALLAGTMSYRSWREFSGLKALLRAEGNESAEFLSLAGLFISFTLGAGMVWLCLPLFIVQMCIRMR